MPETFTDFPTLGVATLSAAEQDRAAPIIYTVAAAIHPTLDQHLTDEDVPAAVGDLLAAYDRVAAEHGRLGRVVFADVLALLRWRGSSPRSVPTSRRPETESQPPGPCHPGGWQSAAWE
jgi:hypothetical protein